MTFKKIAIVFIILILGLVLRLHNYQYYPQRGATSDEYSYTFQGVSLLTKGIPISWSAFPAYKNRFDLTIDHIYFPMVYPYFDHTPLNGIMVGAWSILWGGNTFTSIDLKVIRLAPIIFSTISSILVFLITLELYGYTTGILSLLVYSTTVIFIIQSRVVLSENLLSLWSLVSVYLLIKFKNKINPVRAVTLGILSGLAFWTKEIGIAVFISQLFLFINQKIRFRWILVMSLTLIMSVLLYFLYGISYDAQVFWNILKVQSSRLIGPETLLYVLSTPVIINKVYFDGWYFLGFLALALMLIDFKKNKFIIVPALSYFCLLLLALTQKGEMGWYLIPLFPFMAIASGWMINLSLTKYRQLFFLVLIFIGQYSIAYLIQANLGLTPIVYRVLTILIFGPFVAAEMFNWNKLFNKLIVIYLSLFFLINIYLTFGYVHPA